MSNADEAARQMTKVARSFRTMERRSEDITPVLRQVGNKIALWNRRTWATKGAFVGSPWKPLAPSTVKQKLKQGWPRGPVERTGETKRSFIGRPMGIERYGPRGGEWGSGVQKAVWQHYGTRRHGKRHIPPRVLMRITQSQAGEIRHMIAEYIVKNRKPTL